MIIIITYSHKPDETLSFSQGRHSVVIKKIIKNKGIKGVCIAIASFARNEDTRIVIRLLALRCGNIKSKRSPVRREKKPGS